MRQSELMPDAYATSLSCIHRSESNPRVSMLAFRRISVGERPGLRLSCSRRSRSASPAPPPKATRSPCMASRRCRPISTTCPGSIPMRPRADAWCGAFSAPSTASIRMIVRGIAPQQVRSYNFERGYVIESLMARGEDEPFTLYGLIAQDRRDRRCTGSTSPSISTRARTSRTASRSRPKTCCSPGSCCAITAGPTIGSIIPRSPRPKRSIASPCALISPAPMIASCR